MRGTDQSKWPSLHVFLKYHLPLSLYSVVGEVARLDCPSMEDVLVLCSYTYGLVCVTCLNHKGEVARASISAYDTMFEFC